MRLLLLSLCVCALTVMNAQSQSMEAAGFDAGTIQFGYPEWPQSSQGVMMLNGGGSTLSLAPGSFLYAPNSSSNISTVPEPTTALLVLGGLGLLWLQSRRSRRVILG